MKRPVNGRLHVERKDRIAVLVFIEGGAQQRGYPTSQFWFQSTSDGAVVQEWHKPEGGKAAPVSAFPAASILAALNDAEERAAYSPGDLDYRPWVLRRIADQ